MGDALPTTLTKSHDNFIHGQHYNLIRSWFSYQKVSLFFIFYFYFFNNIFINELLRGSTRLWSVQSYNGKEMMQLWCSLDWKSPSFLFVLLWFIWPGFEPTQPFGRENITYISHTSKNIVHFYIISNMKSKCIKYIGMLYSNWNMQTTLRYMKLSWSKQKRCRITIHTLQSYEIFDSLQMPFSLNHNNNKKDIKSSGRHDMNHYYFFKWLVSCGAWSYFIFKILLWKNWHPNSIE